MKRKDLLSKNFRARVRYWLEAGKSISAIARLENASYAHTKTVAQQEQMEIDAIRGNDETD